MIILKLFGFIGLFRVSAAIVRLLPGVACNQADSICYGSLGNTTSYLYGSGTNQRLLCINQATCNLLVFGQVQTDKNDVKLIHWKFFMKSPFTKMLLSISQHKDPFDPTTDYLYTEVTRVGEDTLIQEHKIHSTGATLNSPSTIPCQYGSDEEEKFATFDDSKSCPILEVNQFTSRGAVSANFKTKTKVYYEPVDGFLRPYVSYLEHPYYIHMRAEAPNGAVEMASSSPFFLFRAKGPLNNPIDQMRENVYPTCEQMGCDKYTIFPEIPKPATTVVPITSSDSATESTTIKEEKSNSMTIIIVVIVVIALLLLFVGLLLLYLVRKRKAKSVPNKKGKNDSISSSTPVRSEIVLPSSQIK